MVLNLCSELSGPELEPHIAALIGSGALMEAATNAGIPAEHFDFRFPADPRGIARIIRYCRKHRIDIVQTHGLRADSVGRWAARLGGVKGVVSTIHSIDPWRRKPHVLLDRVTSPFVSHYVAVCNAAKQAAIRRGEVTENNCSVVYIGVPQVEIPKYERDAMRSELGIQPDAFPVVGVLANLRDMKGHRHIISALPSLRKHLPDIKFVFAGRDDSGGEVEQLAVEAGADNSIIFAGFVKDTPRLFAALDVFLLPSEWEGFPVSILEAMQAGVPIVATNVGGIPEMIRNEQDGLLIPPRDPAAIEGALVQLMQNFALRASMVKSADARYQTEFTVQEMAGKISNLYKKLLKNTC